MQEHPQYKITPDQAWSKMETLLDASMPVTHRSRRFMVFWWTLAAVTAIGLASLFIMKQTKVPSIPPVSTVAKTPLALNETTVPAEAIQKHVADTDNKAESDVTNHTPTIKAKEPSAPVHTSVVSNTIAKHVSSKNGYGKDVYQKDASDKVVLSAPVFVAPEQKLNDDLAEKAETMSKPVDESSIQEMHTEEGFLSAIDDAGTIRKKSFIVEFLPLANIQDDRTLDDAQIDLIAHGDISVARRSHPFSPGVSMGVMAGSQNGLGVNGAVGAEYAINSKLSLTGHVGYSSYQPNAFFNEHKDLTAYEPLLNMDANYGETYISAEKVNSYTDYNAINPFVKSIELWNVSGGVKFALTKRFFVEGGASLGFGIKAKSEYPIVDFNTNATPTSGLKVGTSFNPFDIIRSNMTSLQGGIGYHAGRHLSISLGWTQGLNHYLLNDQLSTIDSAKKRSDYIRGLNFGISYNL